MIWRVQSYQNRYCLFLYSKDAKTDPLKPLSSIDITKIKDTFYIEWQSKYSSLSWYVILWVWQLSSFCILALKRPTFTGTQVSDEDNIKSYKIHFCSIKYDDTVSQLQMLYQHEWTWARFSSIIARFWDRFLIATFCPLHRKPVDTVDWQVAKKIGSLSYYTKMMWWLLISTPKLKGFYYWDSLVTNTEPMRKDGNFM